MFKKILIANRGEIACRIIKTARRMGIKTVAVYSEADKDALHVEMSDEAVAIGPPAAAQSYLVIDKIVDACKATGAEAVHPGYGFLSERAAFAHALAAAKIVFIGPNPRAIEAMGDKIESKKFANAAKVSTVPGYLGVIESAERAAEIADEIGYPVMIKASAGGGGKGMRIAHSRQEVSELVTGVDLVEEMIRSAAGEPLRLKQADVKLAGWAVESRVYAEDPTRGFLPSTGRLAKYRPPPEGVRHGVTVRNDTGVYEGGEISIHYDPMIAKLVTHAPDRLGAIEAQATALDAFVIDGIRHNIPFLSALMQHPRWREGRLSTGFIAEEFPDGFHPLVAEGETERRLVVAAAMIDHTHNLRKRHISGQLREPEQMRFELKRVVAMGKRRVELEIEPRMIGVGILFADGRKVEAHSDWKPGDPLWRGAIDGADIAVQARPILNGYALSHAGVAVDTRVYTRREAELAALMIEHKGADGSRFLLCPMPGLVKAIAVKVGQEVKAGDQLCIVEAMKMENVLNAERDATVKAILCKEGDSLAVDAVIMEFA